MEKINIETDDGICTSVNKYVSRYYVNDENLKKSLKNSYLWFSNPLNFNDPYDCNLTFGNECSYEEIYEYLINENAKCGFGLIDNEIKVRAKFLFDNPLERKKLSKKSDCQTIAQKGICCFSQKNDSLLMWSHYGDKHKGICLTFDITKNLLSDSIILNIEYPDRYPVHNWPRDKAKFHSLRFLLGTKSQEWKYEDEIRIVRDYLKPPFRGRVKFKKNALMSISFGYKSTEKDVKKIRNLLSKADGYNHVKFFKAELKELEFGIIYNELPNLADKKTKSALQEVKKFV